MPASITIDKIFEIEPYRSMLNLLINFKKEGLTLKEIQYCIAKKHYLNHISVDMKTKLDEAISYLLENGKIKKYQIKLINRKNKKRQKTIKKLSSKAENAEKVRNNIRNFLIKLMKKPIEAIDKQGNIYRISEFAYNIGVRLQNIESLDFFPSEKIIDFNITKKGYQDKEYIAKKVILYGLSKELFKNMRGVEKDFECLINEMDQCLEKIIKKKKELWKNENRKRVKQFLNTTKNERIKKVLMNQNMDILGIFSFYVDLNKYDNSFLLKCIDLTKSKEHFFLQFKYGITTQRSNISNLENNEKIIGIIRWMDNLSNVEYGKLWCKTFSHKEYDLTRNDIYKIIEWVWDNRDFFDMFFPMDLALSLYGSRDENKMIIFK